MENEKNGNEVKYCKGKVGKAIVGSLGVWFLVLWVFWPIRGEFLPYLVKKNQFTFAKVALNTGWSDVEDLGYLPLTRAIEEKNEKLIKFLLLEKVDDFDLLKATSISHLSKYSLAIRSALLEQCSGRSLDDEAVFRVISDLLVEQKDLRVIKIMFHYLKNANITNRNGQNLLHIAMDINSKTVDVEGVEFLLKKKVNPNKFGYIAVGDYWTFNVTPFIQAAMRQDTTLISLFLKYKADPNIFQRDGFGVLHAAYPNLEVLTTLLDGGANVNMQDSEGQTVLLQATQDNNIEVVKFLIKKKANPDISDMNGTTPLSVAMAQKKLCKSLSAEKCRQIIEKEVKKVNKKLTVSILNHQ